MRLDLMHEEDAKAGRKDGKQERERESDGL
jgi:hypothetical protein